MKSLAEPPPPSSTPSSLGSAPDLLTGLLRDVSRSFYLTLRVLPTAVRRPIGLGYLLARATDTIADTDLIPVSARLEALGRLRARILGQSQGPMDMRQLILAQSRIGPDVCSLAERQLLERIDSAVALLDTLTSSNRAQIREVLATITSGQELDLQRFRDASAHRPTALGTDEELADYTYRVAGCVGKFWTEVCHTNLFPTHPVSATALIADGIRYGQGLQMVNILRDLPKDLRQGRCYLPGDRLRALGLQPVDLFAPTVEPQLRPLYRELLARADEHLAAGWRYTCNLPANQRRLRLGCAWPVLIGWQTTARLRSTNVLDATQRVKISRHDVYRILASTLWRLPFRKAWAGLPDRFRAPA